MPIISTFETSRSPAVAPLQPRSPLGELWICTSPLAKNREPPESELSGPGGDDQNKTTAVLGSHKTALLDLEQAQVPARTLGSQWLAKIVSPSEFKKMMPLGMMLFCILFNYTILKNTKDVLVVTAPKSGAEIIPFLKTYVIMPGAVCFTIAFTLLSNRFTQAQVFNGVIISFLLFFGSFALLLYPNRDWLHPYAFCDWAALQLPGAFAVPLSIVRSWTYSLFYLFSEMWGSVVVSLLFWGFANQVTSVQEAKQYYPIFGVFANIALIICGQFIKGVSEICDGLPDADDKWMLSLRLLMGGVIVSGVVILCCFNYMQMAVLSDPNCVSTSELQKAEGKTKMGLVDSFKYIVSSLYIRQLAVLVISFGMSLNLVEVTWKARLKVAFPDPNEYSEFLASFSSYTGAVTIVLMLSGRWVLRTFGWNAAAFTAPAVLLITGCIFFSLVLYPDLWSNFSDFLGTSPLMLSVLVGAAQNILAKGSKFAFFDPCKEMAYIPLEPEQKTKGKAAVDVIGGPLGKSSGSLVQQILIVSLGSLAACTPLLAGILFVIVGAWLRATYILGSMFTDRFKQNKKECDL